MNYGKFSASINDSIALLNKFDLFKSKGPKSNGIYSEEFLKISKSNNLLKIHECAVRNLDYNILLTDDSVIQFQWQNNDLRYCFIQNPYKFISKEDFLTVLYSKELLEELLTEFSLDDIISENEENYEQYLNEQNSILNSNYFRYDYSRLGYQPLVHSCSHFHIGLSEHVRIVTSKVITPLKFTKFCIKNTYYEAWKKHLNNNPEFSIELLKIKSECNSLPREHWEDIEGYELHLT